MNKICAWCNKRLGTEDEAPKTGTETNLSHGICYECANKIHSKIGIDLSKFIDFLDAPVVIVAETGIIKTANKNAQKLVNKTLSEIEGSAGGNVFECAYSKLPDGCGKTIHCSGCTIRKAVMDTFQSGNSHNKMPAYLNVGDPSDPQKIDLLISTEKVKGVVLLRIDKFGSENMVQPAQ